MPQPDRADVSILMPAYQLGTAIAANIDRVAGLADRKYEVIVIDDGSTDDTRTNAEKAAAAYDHVTVAGYDVNRGKGGALKEGFHQATADTIVFLDADLDLPPEQLPGFLNEFDRLDIDVLVGAKRAAMVPGRYPALRRLLSLTFSAVGGLLLRLPVRETQTGIKAFRRGVLTETLPKLETERYAFDLELLARIRRAGGSMAETPVALAKASSSGVSLATLWEMGRDTVKIWFRSFRW